MSGKNKKSILQKTQQVVRGRAHPLALGLIVLISALVFHRSWWWVGLVLILFVFIEAWFRYTSLD